MISDTGAPLFGDEVMIILSREVLKKNPNATIISEVKSSNRLYSAIKNSGGNPIMWKTGHSLIKEKMKETNAILAGEMSGHIFFKDKYYGFDDAIYASVRFSEILVNSNKKSLDLISDIPKAIATPEIRVECDESIKFKLIKEVEKNLKKKYSNINSIDGVRLDFDYGWGLIRASNTESSLVMRFEATNEEKLKSIKKILKESLTQASKKLNHPKNLV